MSAKRRSTYSENKKNVTNFYTANENNLVETVDSVDSSYNTEENYSGDAVNHKIYLFGEEDAILKPRGPLQDYSKLLQEHIEKGTLFQDDSFNCEKQSLSVIKGEVTWKRPPELVDGPSFIKDGATRFDIDQGQLGDCWFLAAAANLTLNQKLFEFVVPIDQSFTENYAGIFHFRFWQYGKWIDIVIDDKLPTINGELIYVKSTGNQKEFWAPLLEKAYAKLYGSYNSIDGGQISEALEDMCGGVSEYYMVADQPFLFQIMDTSSKRSSFMGSSITDIKKEGILSNGLVTTHAYSITDVTNITIDGNDIHLIRLRNPWGNEVEWNGAWSDHSEDWNIVTKATKDSMFSKLDDGEFWMELKDFQKNFTFLDICHTCPSSFIYSNISSKRWHVKMFEGAWIDNITAGGGLQHSTFDSNPQYILSLGGGRNKTQAIVIGLLQKNRRHFKIPELPLELAIYKILNPADTVFGKEFFSANQPICYVKNVFARQIATRIHVTAGQYCIIPCTAQPNMSGEYLLRVFSEVAGTLQEEDEEFDYTEEDESVKDEAIRVVNQSFRKSFEQISSNKDEVDWIVVRQILNDVYAKPDFLCMRKPRKTFSKETCRNIVTLWDQNFSGKLNGDEFWKLLTDVATLEMNSTIEGHPTVMMLQVLQKRTGSKQQYTSSVT